MDRAPAGPTISVALCTHNGARWIAAQVRSILEQTLVPDELVVSDDASSDDTLEQIESLVSGSGITLTILRNESPLGVTANFQQALTATTGELVALSDQDDVWEPDRIERAVALLAQRPDVELVFGDARIIDADGAPSGPTLFGELGLSATERDEIARGRALDALVRRSLVTGATVMVRRGLVDRAEPFPASWVHDEWLAVVAAVTAQVAISPGELIGYRIHGSNQIGVSRLTAATAWQRLTSPRGPRNARMASAWAALAARVGDWGERVSPPDARLVYAKAAHEEARNALPGSRWRRIRPVLAAARRGDYGRYSRGAQDVLRDLVQPAAPRR